MASVIGHCFDIELLGSLLGMENKDVYSAIWPSVKADLVWPMYVFTSQIERSR